MKQIVRDQHAIGAAPAPMTTSGARASPSPHDEVCRGGILDKNRRPHILLGVTGSVAAVKGPKLALRLAREVKADVRVILTRTVENYFWKEGKAVSSYDVESWRDFSVATSSAAIDAESNNDDWRSSDGQISLHYAEEEWTLYTSLRDTVLHIDLRSWADIAVIAPLSAHSLAKIANGLCDDLLTCCIRAWDFGQGSTSNGGNWFAGKPLILAPAMNTCMWCHPLTKIQLETIKKFPYLNPAIDDDEISENGGIIIVEPAVKTLACGETGAGALAELDDIIRAVDKCLVMSGFRTAIVNNDVWNGYSSHNSSSASSKQESMKRALLLYAKQRFRNMKSSHEQTLTSPNSNFQLAAPISPTPNLIIEAFLPRLDLNTDSYLVDLGCGDGRWLIAAHEHAKCRCLGIDVADDRLVMAQESISKNKLEKLVKVRKVDVFQFVKHSNDICIADVIVIYLFREAMTEIGTLLSRRYNGSQKSVTILSIGFALPGWTPVYEEKIGGIRVYMYSTRG